MCEWDDLVIFSVHYKCGHFNLLEVFGEISLRKSLNAVVVGFDPAHHALTPPVVPYALGNDGSWPVVTVERKRDVLVELGSILRCALANLIEDFDRRSARVLVRFDHDWRNSADQHRLRDSPLAVLRHITGNFSTAGRMANVNRVPKIQLLGQFGDVGGMGVHLVPGNCLGGAPMSPPVVSDHAKAALEKEHHLSVPIVC